MKDINARIIVACEAAGEIEALMGLQVERLMEGEPTSDVAIARCLALRSLKLARLVLGLLTDEVADLDEMAREISGARVV